VLGDDLLRHLPHQLCKLWVPVVYQDLLVQLLQLRVLVRLQLCYPYLVKYCVQCLADLRLYLNWHEFLHEVLHCPKLICLLVQFFVELLHILLELYELLL